MNLRKMVLLGVLATLSISGVALAATGSVDATKKTATFSGTITTDPVGLYEIAVFFNGGTAVNGQNTCAQPQCDEHTLTVGPDGAQLKLDATSDAYSLDLEVVDPSGAVTEVNGYDQPDFSSEQHLTLDATPGNWTIRVYGASDLDTFDYDLKATFRTPEEVALDPPADE
jgi:hypothetical protein